MRLLIEIVIIGGLLLYIWKLKRSRDEAMRAGLIVAKELGGAIYELHKDDTD